MNIQETQKKIYAELLRVVKETIENPDLSDREKFAIIYTYSHTCHIYYGQFTMQKMNFNDLDLTKFYTENFPIDSPFKR